MSGFDHDAAAHTDHYSAFDFVIDAKYLLYPGWHLYVYNIDVI